MQDDISTTAGGRTDRMATKTKKTPNGKWAAPEVADMDNESSPATSDSEAHGLDVNGMISTARSAYESVVSRGSDVLSKVDLSRGTSIIRDYPIQAAVGGLIVGFILGAAVSRRQS